MVGVIGVVLVERGIQDVICLEGRLRNLGVEGFAVEIERAVARLHAPELRDPARVADGKAVGAQASRMQRDHRLVIGMLAVQVQVRDLHADIAGRLAILTSGENTLVVDRSRHSDIRHLDDYLGNRCRAGVGHAINLCRDNGVAILNTELRRRQEGALAALHLGIAIGLDLTGGIPVPLVLKFCSRRERRRGPARRGVGTHGNGNRGAPI